MLGTLKQRIGSRLGGRHRGFGRNVLLLFSGNSLGQLGSVLASPLLTRLYDPEAFGVLGALSGVLTLLAVFAALGYEFSLPLARSDQEVSNLLAVCALALMATTAACALVVFAMPSTVLHQILGIVTPYRAFLPVGLLCLGTGSVMAMFGTYCRAYGVLARIGLYRGTVGPLFQIALGVSGLHATGLPIGFILGQSSGTGLAVRRLLWVRRPVLGPVSWHAIAGLARRYARFPLFSSWAGLVQMAGTGPALMFALPLLFSSKVAGLVFLADRIVGRPLVLVSGSIMLAYTGEVSKIVASNPAELRRRFFQITSRQLAFSGTWILLANLAAPFVFPPLFGAQWSDAVVFMHILSIAYLMQSVTRAVGHTLQILERQSLLASWSIGRFLVIASGFWVSHRYGFTAPQSVLLYSISQAAAEAANFFLMYRSILRLRKGERL
jgi:O-antigen/teichoic acid export membrane protein